MAPGTTYGDEGNPDGGLTMDHRPHGPVRTRSFTRPTPLRQKGRLRAVAGVIFFVTVAITLLLHPKSLQADGGTLRAANVPIGPYRISVYTDPTPIPPDTIDLSVLATFERGRGLAPGLEIEVVARRMDGAGPVVRHAATKEQAEDPRYYAAKFALGAVGEWEISVSVRGPEGEGDVRFTVTVREPGFFGNPFLIIGFALAPLVLVGLWLRGTRPETGAETVS